MANIEPGELDRRHPGSRWWMRLLAAGLPAAVLMQMAANLYAGNAENLTGGREGLATLVALGVVLCAALFVGLQWGRTAGKLLWAVPAAYALFVVIRDIAFPLSLGELDGSNPLMAPALGYVALEALTFTCALVILLVLRAEEANVLTGICTIVFSVSTLAVLAGRAESAEADALLAGKAVVPQSSKADVYQVVFDGYQADEYGRMREARGIAPFDDFIWFKNNISNYDVTSLSVASFFMSTLYAPELKFHDWRLRYEHDGLMKTLRANGYRVRVFGDGVRATEWKQSPFVDYVRTQRDVAEEYASGGARQQDLQEFLQLVKLLCYPAWVGSRLYAPDEEDRRLHAAPPSRGHWAFYSTRQFREMVAGIQRTRPNGNYTYVHMMLPHEPYVMTENAEYVIPKQGTRQGHLGLIDRLVGELVAELKRLGRYDDSMLIVHGDHGFALDNWTSHPDNNSEERRPLAGVMERTRAALLIKPPHHQGYDVPESPTQLLDISPTILGAVGIAGVGGLEGVDVLASPPGPDRVRRCYTYRHWQKRLDEYVVRHGKYELGRKLPLS